jgi:hypothetical protein
VIFNIFICCKLSDSNNNCNFVTHKNCCNGCGPQEQFYGCSDVSIERATNIVHYASQTTPRAPPHPFQERVTRPERPMGFIPIDVIGRYLKEAKIKT